MGNDEGADPRATAAAVLMSPARLASYSPDGSMAMVVEDYPYCARVRDIRRGLDLGRPMPHTEPIHAVAFSPDGRRVATGSYDNSARVWDARTDRTLTPPLRQINYIRAIAFSPDGRTLATGGFDHSIQLWDPGSGERRADSFVLPYIIVSLSYSPDGSAIAVGMDFDKASPAPGRGGLELIDARTGRPLIPSKPDLGPVGSVEFSRDGRRLLALLSEATQAQLFRSDTGVPEGPLLVPGQSVQLAALGPDGRSVVIGAGDDTVRLRDATTGRPLCDPVVLGSAIRALGFGPDGRTFVAGTDDSRVRIFDAATARPLGPATSLGSAAIGVGYADGGGTVLATSAAGETVRIPVPRPDASDPDRLARRVEELTGRRMAGDLTIQPLDPGKPREGTSPGEGERDVGPDWGPRPDDEGIAAWHRSAADRSARSGDRFAALWHLGRWAAIRPGDWLPPARRAELEWEVGRAAEAAEDERRARQIGGEAALLDWHAQMVVNQRRAGRLDQALRHVEHLVAAEPDGWRHLADRAAIRRSLGDGEGARLDRVAAARLGAEPGVALSWIEEAAARGAWAEAAAIVAAMRLPWPDPYTAVEQFLALLKAGDEATARRMRGGILQSLRASPHAFYTDGLLGVLALRPWPIEAPEEMIAAARENVGKLPPGARHIALSTLGSLLQRAGRSHDAIARLDEGIKLRGAPLGRDPAFLALANRDLGRRDVARSCLAKLEAWTPDPSPRSLWANAEVELLREEVRASLAPNR